MFDGTWEKLRPFIAQLRTKLIGDAYRFRDEAHKISYALALLTGKAYLQVLPLVNSTTGTIQLESVNTLITLLENAFGDPDRIATAERNLENLYQRNRDFSDYLADF